MINRKQKVIELMEGLQSLRRDMIFRPARTINIPRITPSQWGVLMIIEEWRKSTVKDVASALSITSSAATQLVDGLVTSGYVVRQEDAKDRRQVTLTLSKKTKLGVDKIKEQNIKHLLTFFKVLNDKEFNQFIILNNKIVERFSKK